MHLRARTFLCPQYACSYQSDLVLMHNENPATPGVLYCKVVYIYITSKTKASVEFHGFVRLIQSSPARVKRATTRLDKVVGKKVWSEAEAFFRSNKPLFVVGPVSLDDCSSQLKFVFHFDRGITRSVSRIRLPSLSPPPARGVPRSFHVPRLSIR